MNIRLDPGWTLVIAGLIVGSLAAVTLAGVS